MNIEVKVGELDVFVFHQAEGLARAPLLESHIAFTAGINPLNRHSAEDDQRIRPIRLIIAHTVRMFRRPQAYPQELPYYFHASRPGRVNIARS